MAGPVPIAQWREVLAGVTGTEFARPDGVREMRVASTELIALLGHPATVSTWMRVAPVMRSLGWDGPATKRFGDRAIKAYSRPIPGVSEPEEQSPDTSDSSTAIVATERRAQAPKPLSPDEELAHKLEKICKLSLDKIEEILSMPTNSSNGNVLRAQTACASAAVQAQLRADETRLRTRRNDDVLERLLKIISRERKAMRQAKRIAAKARTLDIIPQADVIADDIDQPLP